MPATAIVGGQYGSEGKGKVTALTASAVSHPWVVRCGGPNSGHTIWINNKKFVLRQLPAAAPQADAHLAIAAGCVVDETRLLEEIRLLGVDSTRLVVDPRAVLVESSDRDNEASLTNAIASTGSGTGSAAARRLLRDRNVRLVDQSRAIREAATVDIVAPRLHSALDEGQHVIIEGTQGFGLSLLHGSGYPYLTSKDTTASAFAMEAGLAPSDVMDVTVVIRTFPIRVGGKSGDLPNEVTWRFVEEYSDAPEEEPEFTSVTDRLRRVALFDIELIRSACRYNRPTSIAVMGLDRLDYANRGVVDFESLSSRAIEFLDMLRLQLDVPIGWIGTGFSTTEAFNLLCANAATRRY
jgi:adenylosuccinate synthase